MLFICRTTNSIEREIAERQLGMKAINDNSWFSKLKQILAIYELPSSHSILKCFNVSGYIWHTRQVGSILFWLNAALLLCR
jgi:hypothetical protein